MNRDLVLFLALIVMLVVIVVLNGAQHGFQYNF